MLFRSDEASASGVDCDCANACDDSCKGENASRNVASMTVRRKLDPMLFMNPPMIDLLALSSLDQFLLRPVFTSSNAAHSREKTLTVRIDSTWEWLLSARAKLGRSALIVPHTADTTEAGRGFASKKESLEAVKAKFDLVCVFFRRDRGLVPCKFQGAVRSKGQVGSPKDPNKGGNGSYWHEIGRAHV